MADNNDIACNLVKIKVTGFEILNDDCNFTTDDEDNKMISQGAICKYLENQYVNIYLYKDGKIKLFNNESDYNNCIQELNNACNFMEDNEMITKSRTITKIFTFSFKINISQINELKALYHKLRKIVILKTYYENWKIGMVKFHIDGIKYHIYYTGEVRIISDCMATFLLYQDMFMSHISHII